MVENPVLATVKNCQVGAVLVHKQLVTLKWPELHYLFCFAKFLNIVHLDILIGKNEDHE